MGKVFGLTHEDRATKANGSMEELMASAVLSSKTLIIPSQEENIKELSLTTNNMDSEDKASLMETVMRACIEMTSLKEKGSILGPMAQFTRDSLVAACVWEWES